MMGYWRANFCDLLSRGILTASLGIICIHRADALTLDQLITQAIEQHPATQAAAYGVVASRYDVQSAQLARFPVFSVTHDHYWDERQTTLSVQQPLWNGGAIRARIEQAEIQVAQNQANVLLERQQIAQRVLGAWTDYYVAQYRYTLTEQQLLQLQDYAQLIKRRIDAGVSASIEKQLVDSRIQQTRVEQEGAKAQQAIAQDRLERLTGLTALNTTLDLQQLDRQLLDTLKQTQNLSTRIPVLDQHPSLIGASYAIDAAQAAVVTQRAERWPRVFLQYQRQIQHPHIDIDDAGIAVGVEISTDRLVGSWVGSKAAQARVQAAEATRQAVAQQVTDEWMASAQQIISLQHRLTTLQLAVESARLVEASYLRQFSAGHKSWLEVLNAVRETEQTEQTEQSLAEAQVNLVALGIKWQMDQGLMNWQHIGSTP